MKVLAVGAHPDDVELGCGATLLRHAARGDEITILVMSSGDLGSIEGMSRRGEQDEAARRIGATLLWAGYDDGNVAGRTRRDPDRRRGHRREVG